MLFFLLFFTTSLAACPNYQCASLGKDICMIWNSGTITFNSNGCTTTDYICSYANALAAYTLNSTSGTFSCQPSSEFPAVIGYTYCGTLLSSKVNLFNGTYPKKCSTLGYNDANCLLQDKSYTNCKCGFDSNLYCQPNPSSYIYDNFWKKCSKNDDVVSAGFFLYYQTLYTYYVEYNTKLQCTSSLFKEFGIISGSIPANSFQEYIIISLSAFLFVV